MAKTDGAAGQLIVEAIARRMADAGYTYEDVGRLRRISSWQQAAKVRQEDGTDKLETTDLYGFQLAPSWEDGPAWPVIQPARPVKVPPIRRNTNSTNTKTTVILPDPQIGFRRIDGELIPTHDTDAMNVALMVAAEVQPDRIVNLGDYLDLPEWSTRWLVSPEQVETTQPALDYGHEYLARQRSICDHVDLLEGNHDERIGQNLAKNASAALRLRPACTPPDSWPVLSVQNLLRLDDLGVTYHDGYPANRTKVTTGNDDLTPLYAIHGQLLDVAKAAKVSRQSYVQGHIHRRAMHCETYEVDGRPITVQVFSPGCLCRIDGAVPSVHSSSVRKRHVTRFENWTQGMAVVTETDNGDWAAEIVPIHRGRALWRGKVFEA